MPTKIEWASETWNPLLGCTKVSPGCGMPRFEGDKTGGCYAIRQARMRASNPNPKIADAFAGLVERNDAGELDWTGRVNLLDDRLTQPFQWREPRRIFVNSLSDLFHDEVPDAFIARVFAVMAIAQRHTFQLLTKRHGRMRSLLSNTAFHTLMEVAAREFAPVDEPDAWAWGWPLPNVWLGVSVEDQKWADLRIPALLDTPAAMRWLSCEPLLGPVDLSAWLDTPPVCGCGVSPDGAPGWVGGCCAACMTPQPSGLDWVVAGGESGPGARPMDPAWMRTLRDQCQAAGVAYLVKQWGDWAPRGRGIGMSRHNAGREVLIGPPLDDMGQRQVMRRVGKKAAGRELDGRIWDEYPTAVPT